MNVWMLNLSNFNILSRAPNSADKSKQSKYLSCRKVSVQSRVRQVRSDAPNTSHAVKFLVLKPGRKNSVASSLNGNANRRVANGLATALLIPTASKSSNNAIVSALEIKVAAMSLNSRMAVDDRPSQTPSQSRSNFFNLVRGKASSSASAILSDSSLATSSPSTDTSGDISKGGCEPESSRVAENGNGISCNVDAPDTSKKTRKISDFGENICPNGAIYLGLKRGCVPSFSWLGRKWWGR